MITETAKMLAGNVRDYGSCKRRVGSGERMAPIKKSANDSVTC